jgi:hypothetical protein
MGVDRYVRELRRLWWAKAAHELTWRAFCSQEQIASCIAQRASPLAFARQVSMPQQIDLVKDSSAHPDIDLILRRPALAPSGGPKTTLAIQYHA